MAESFSLDGLALNDGTTFRIFDPPGVDMTPPRQRQEWIGAADSEWQALSRNPLHENREIVIPLKVVPTATKDLALDKIGQIQDKLRLASLTQDGIALTWTPDGSSRTVTFDVLAGEITGLPLDFLFITSKMPRPTLRLVCKPYWRGTETLTTTASTSTPFVTKEITGVTGDIPALGRLIVTDTATQSRRHVEWGIEGQFYSASTSLLIASDDMVTSGFAGTQTTTTGAYDPNAAGNNSITAGIITDPTAVVGTGNLSHIGTFAVKGRVQATTATAAEVRLAWQVADGPWSHNEWAAISVGAATWQEVDLGTIVVPQVVSGTQRWTGRIEARTTSGTDTLKVNYLELIPTGEGYGKARSIPSTSPGVVVAYDQFTGTTSGAALNATTPPLGAAWATSGVATDFAFIDAGAATNSDEAAARSTASSGARYGVLGSTMTAQQVKVRTGIEFLTFDSTLSLVCQSRSGLVARFTDTNNHLRVYVFRSRTSGVNNWELLFSVRKLVAGVETTLYTTASGFATMPLTSYVDLEALVQANGSLTARLYDSSGTVLAQYAAIDSDLATGGTLQTGKGGILDDGIGTSASAGTSERWYDNVVVSEPLAEPITLYSGRNMQFRHDDTIRQDSTGTYTGRPSSYRGSRFLVPVGTSRVVVKARRNDVETMADTNVTDATQIQIGWTPRGIAVPR